jgi:hypothetical protein
MRRGRTPASYTLSIGSGCGKNRASNLQISLAWIILIGRHSVVIIQRSDCGRAEVESAVRSAVETKCALLRS